LAVSLLKVKRQRKSNQNMSQYMCHLKHLGLGAATTASPPSDGTSSDHYDDPGSPLGQPNGSTFTNTGHHMHSHMLWLAGHCSGTKAATILI
jgi:hypothetical protein